MSGWWKTNIVPPENSVSLKVADVYSIESLIKYNNPTKRFTTMGDEYFHLHIIFIDKTLLKQFYILIVMSLLTFNNNASSAKL